MALSLTRSGLRLGLVAWLGVAACGEGPGPVVRSELRGELTHPGAPHAAHVAGPALAVSREGDAWLAFIRSVDAERSVELARLAGDDFEVTRIEPAGSPPAASHQAPGLAVGPDGRVHVSWSTPRSDPGASFFASDLVLSSSAGGAGGFGIPVRLNEDRPGSRGFEALAVAPTGALLAAWIEGGRTSRARALRIEPDGSRHAATLDEQACPCCRFAVEAAEGDRIGLLWRDELPGAVRDMVFSLARAGSFGEALPVHPDGWSLDACPHRGGALAFAPGGRALVAWYTEGEDGAPRLQLAWGDASGFASPVVVHEDGDSLPDRVALAVDEAGSGLVLWERRTPVRSEIAVRAIPGEGAPLGPTRVLSRGIKASHPEVAAAPGGGFVAAWNEEAFPTLRTVVVALHLETGG